MEHEPFTEWAALYALEALDEEERTQFEVHLATGCQACTSMLSELSTVVGALAWAAPAASPRPELREKLLMRVRTEEAPQLPTPASSMTRPSLWVGWHWVLWAGRVAVAGLVGFLGWALYDAQGQLGEQRVVNQQLTEELAQERVLTSLVAHTDTHVAALANSQPTTPPSTGWIVWSPSKQRGFMVVHFLRRCPSGRRINCGPWLTSRRCHPRYFRSIRLGTLRSWCLWPSPILVVSRSLSNQREARQCRAAP